MCVLYILCHYYVTIIRIIYPIIFPIMSQRCIISLYYVTIMSLLLLLFVLLFHIISKFRLPIFRSWWTPILVRCTERWLISVQERQQSLRTNMKARFMQPSQHLVEKQLKKRLLYALFLVLYLLFWMSVQTSRGKTDSENAPEGSSKHCLLAKPCWKALHFAKSGGAVYNDHVRAQPMARLKRLEIGKRTLVLTSRRAFHLCTL